MSVNTADEKLELMTGPGTWDRWVRWKNRTEDHVNRNAVKMELEKLLTSVRVSKIKK